jgi:hypothetical protein
LGEKEEEKGELPDMEASTVKRVFGWWLRRSWWRCRLSALVVGWRRKKLAEERERVVMAVSDEGVAGWWSCW